MFYDTEVRLTLPETITEAEYVRTGGKLPIKYENGKATIIIPEWNLHALIVLRF